ncbi:hypothetical protein LCGC14_0626160 [marine sediment metagenome]|uniref:Uncharacterized protein n=1 Tax=marine sediment metagenome TaxID=412755 RepID=A0A0F9TPS7_9ZZZZ
MSKKSGLPPPGNTRRPGQFKKKELDVQALLVKTVRDMGGFAYKLSNRFKVGVLDLLVQLPPYPTVLIEVKCPITPVHVAIPVALTAQQRRFMRDYQWAGGYAGWLVVAQCTRGGRFMMYTGTDPTVTVIDFGTHQNVGVYEKKYLRANVRLMVKLLQEHHP